MSLPLRNVTSRHVTLPSGRVLWTEVYGPVDVGEPVILFANGMASTTNAWTSLVCSLPKTFLARHTLVLHDCANTGKSPYQPELPPPTLASLAADAKSVVESLGFSSGYFVGHSFGGQQGFVAAAQDSDFWKALLLLAPQTDRVNPWIYDSMSATLGIFKSDPESAVYADGVYETPGPSLLAANGIYGALAREMALRQRSESLALAFDALLAPKEGNFAWHDMKTKIVVVYGDRDEIAPVSEGQYAIQMLERNLEHQYELIVLQGCGHWLQWEHEARIGDMVMDLVRSQEHDKVPNTFASGPRHFQAVRL